MFPACVGRPALELKWGAMHRVLRHQLVSLLGLAAIGCGSDENDSVVQAVGACGQCYCYDSDTWPTGYEAQTVPRNPRLLVPARSNQRISFRDSDGSELQVYVAEAGPEDLVWVRPRELLNSGTRYEIRVSDPDADAGNPIMTVEAGEDVDSTPLAYSGAELAPSQSSGTCDLELAARLSVSSLRDDQQPNRRVYADLELDLGDGNVQRVILPFTSEGKAQSADFGAGARDHGAQCLLARHLNAIDPDTSGRANVVFYDLGGNATPVHDLLPVEFSAVKADACPSAPNGGFGDGAERAETGCSTTATPSRDVTSLSFWLASALLVRWRSRRPLRRRPDSAV